MGRAKGPLKIWTRQPDTLKPATSVDSSAVSGGLGVLAPDPPRGNPDAT